MSGGGIRSIGVTMSAGPPIAMSSDPLGDRSSPPIARSSPPLSPRSSPPFTLPTLKAQPPATSAIARNHLIASFYHVARAPVANRVSSFAMMRSRVIRLALLGAIVAALLIVRYTTSFGASLSTARVRELVQQAGVAGVGIFLVAFAVGELLHVPGLVFVGAAVLAWGRAGGGAIAYLGALVSVSVSFAVVRGVGGQP